MDEKAIEIIKRYSSRITKINMDTDFSEIQVDSLAFVSMITELEELYCTTLEDEELDFTLYDTIDDLLALFKRKSK